MIDAPSYAILGRGRWATKIRNVLTAEQRRVQLIGETRRLSDESDANYKARLSAFMRASGAQIAWICIPPGSHIPLMIEAALTAGLNVIVEKPWLCSRFETESLKALARKRGLRVAIHYQYCLLEAVERWRRDLYNSEALRFGGRFTLSRPDRLGISALDNLGSHLLAMRAYAVPRSDVSEITCGYKLPDERCVWIENQHRTLDAIDFLGTNEPLIQRFIAAFETALDRSDFPFTLEFASRVSDDVEALKKSASARPRTETAALPH